MPSVGSTYRSLTENDRINIVNQLLLACEDNKLPHGKIQEVANQFGVVGNTISRLWKRARDRLDNDHNNSPGIFSRKKIVAGALYTIVKTSLKPLSCSP